MGSKTSVLQAVERLNRERERIVGELAQLGDADCKLPAQWGGTQRNINFLLRAFSLHELDHLQHLNRLLVERGRHFNQAQVLLSKAQALRGELVAQLLSLSDEEFEAKSDGSDEWSIRQLVEHLTQTDQLYANN